MYRNLEQLLETVKELLRHLSVCLYVYTEVQWHRVQYSVLNGSLCVIFICYLKASRDESCNIIIQSAFALRLDLAIFVCRVAKRD